LNDAHIDKQYRIEMINTKSSKEAIGQRTRAGKARVSVVDTAIFTIVSRNYISYAATLMQTVAASHQNTARYVFLVDEDDDFSDLNLPATVIITAGAIGIPGFSEMAFRYTIIELNTAIKPFCIQWLFRQAGHRRVIYLDPDIFVLRPLSAVTDLLDRGAPMVLTPHITHPLQDGKQPDDHTIMKSGIYNLGFAAFARTAPVMGFLQWWGDRLVRHCRVDIPDNLFTDQRWMDLAPALVPNTAVLHHPGYNVAYWNLAHRPVSRDRRGAWRAAGKPLHFVHFSGVNPLKPDEFSKHQDRFSLDTIGGLRPLFETYVKRLLANGYEKYITAPYAYACFAEGRKIHWLMRNCFRRLEDAGARPIRVGQDGRSQFYDTVEPELSRPGLPDLTRIMYQLWLERRDLRATFRLDSAEGRLAYSRWFVEGAQAEEKVDDASVRAAAALIGTRSGQPALAPASGPVRSAQPPWSAEDPWRGPACEAHGYLRERVRFTIPGGSAELPRQMAILWERRADIQAAFSLATRQEIDAYIGWCLTDGISGGQIATELLNSEFYQELDTPVALAGIYEDIPITKALWLLYPRCELRDAVAQFPGDRRSRVRLALWFLLEAPRKFRWPRALTARARNYALEPVPSLSIAGVPMPRLLLLLWEAREDLRSAFDPISEGGRLQLLRWFLFIGMEEYGLSAEDLPDYLRSALRASAAKANDELPLVHRLILLHRDDVRAAFDTATVQGRQAYLEWFTRHGTAELLRYGFIGRSAVKAGRKRSSVKASPIAKTPVIVLTGCVSEPTGRGEDVRMTARALAAHRIPFVTLDRSTGVVQDADGHTLEPGIIASAAVNIVHLNADTAFEDYQFLRRYGVGRARLVGYWAWELAKFPQEYLRAFSFYDEIWAATRFAFDAFDIGYRPVRLMPMAVELPTEMAELDRTHFRLPQNRFLFLFTFDFGSYRARKNPEAVIAAFLRAFPGGGEPVGLVIKTINAERHQEQWLGMQAAAKGDRRITLRNGHYTRDETLNLIRICDCYVSLHRSEGFGRGPAEAMLLGRPVVATNYSGNTDFMNGENSFPVKHRLVAIRDGEYPGAEGQVWAEADIRDAAGQMRRTYEDRKTVTVIAEQAQRFMQSHYSAEAIGAKYADWLREFFPRSAPKILVSVRRVRRHRKAERSLEPPIAAQ
jgi:glycosyltransferase involved in cell wall biosynthesis